MVATPQPSATPGSSETPPAMLDTNLGWEERAQLVQERIESLTTNASSRETAPSQYLANIISRSNSSSSHSTEPPPYSALDTGTEPEPDASGSVSALSPVQQLQQLEINYPDQILCPACVEFHPIHGCLARAFRRLLNALPLLHSPFMSCSAYSCTLDSAGGIKINLMTLHLVMRYHRVGPGYGLPLSALSQSCRRTVSGLFLNKAVLTSQSTARIVDNRLILRIATQFRITQALVDQILAPDFSDPRSQDCKRYIHSTICSHASPEGTGTPDIMKNFIDSQNTISSLQRKTLFTQNCPHCSSQYVILDRQRRNGEKSTIKGKERVFQIDRYIDFGECLPEDITEWNAVTKRGTGLDYIRTTRPIDLWRRG